MNLIVWLFIANAIAHIISYQKLKKTKAPNTIGVLTFVTINLVMAFLLWKDVAWSKWLALIFPIIGGLGLLFTAILKGKGTWIDYVILILDILLVSFVLQHFFM